MSYDTKCWICGTTVYEETRNSCPTHEGKTECDSCYRKGTDQLVTEFPNKKAEIKGGLV